eukprot:1068435-Prymnesium_polylepis.1
MPTSHWRQRRYSLGCGDDDEKRAKAALLAAHASGSGGGSSSMENADPNIRDWVTVRGDRAPQCAPHAAAASLQAREPPKGPRGRNARVLQPLAPPTAPAHDAKPPPASGPPMPPPPPAQWLSGERL